MTSPESPIPPVRRVPRRRSDCHGAKFIQSTLAPSRSTISNRRTSSTAPRRMPTSGRSRSRTTSHGRRTSPHQTSFHPQRFLAGRHPLRNYHRDAGRIYGRHVLRSPESPSGPTSLTNLFMAPLGASYCSSASVSVFASESSTTAPRRRGDTSGWNPLNERTLGRLREGYPGSRSGWWTITTLRSPTEPQVSASCVPVCRG